MDGLNTNLNLNAPSTSPRTWPAIGEWGPTGVPSTRQKKRARWITLVLLVIVTTAVVLLGGWLATMLGA